MYCMFMCDNCYIEGIIFYIQCTYAQVRAQRIYSTDNVSLLNLLCLLMYTMYRIKCIVVVFS